MLVPPPLRPGDLIDIVAPSSPCNKTLALRGMGWLHERYRVRFDPTMWTAAGYLAGNDDRRIAELDRALRAHDSKAVVAVRGGYGLHRVAPRVEFRSLLSYPKWLVGFSDATVLHVEASATGVASMHASMVTALGRGDEHARSQWIDMLEHPLRLRRWSDLSVVTPGHALGTSFGGNLTVLHACAAAGRLRIPDNTILLIEDVDEHPYRIDRMLTTLRLGGYFDRVVGIVVGEFTSCAPGPDNVSAYEVVGDVLGALGIPVVSGFPIGHGARNDPIPLGVRVEIAAMQEPAQVLLGSR